MNLTLAFSNDRCGSAYCFKKNSIGTYECYFFDWRTGWFNIWEVGAPVVNPKTYAQAVELCTWHAKKYHWFKYLPKTKPLEPVSGMAGALAAAAGAAAVAGFSL